MKIDGPFVQLVMRATCWSCGKVSLMAAPACHDPAQHHEGCEAWRTIDTPYREDDETGVAHERALAEVKFEPMWDLS